MHDIIIIYTLCCIRYKVYATIVTLAEFDTILFVKRKIAFKVNSLDPRSIISSKTFLSTITTVKIS